MFVTIFDFLSDYEKMYFPNDNFFIVVWKNTLSCDECSHFLVLQYISEVFSS